MKMHPFARVALAATCTLTAVLGTAGLAAADGPPPTDLTVRDQQRPLNVMGAPQFGWTPRGTSANDVQSAYQLRVTRPDGAEVWDSGKVDDDAQSYVDYAGPALARGASYEWSVRTWDGDGDVSGWAPAARFDTGLGDGDWSGAKWIRRVTTGNDSTIDFTLARKQVNVSASPVTRARAYVSAMGQYELHLNGRRVVRDSSFYYPNEAQYTATDVTEAVSAGQPLAIAARYHYWTCTCQGRANGPNSNTTAATALTRGTTNLKVASVGVFDVGDEVLVGAEGRRERVRVTSIGTAGAAGTGVEVTPALTGDHAERDPVIDLAGPSGLIVKVVVDHADGSRQTFVSDETWKVAKDRAYTNDQITWRNSDAGDRVERYDARLETPGWNTAGFDDSGWDGAYAIGAHPLPENPLRTKFTHLEPAIAHVSRRIHEPVSIERLDDGTVIADMGRVVAGVPRVRFTQGVEGRQITLLTSFRRANTLLVAPAAAGDQTIKVKRVGNFVAGDRITVDAPGINKGTGDPEDRTVVAVGTEGVDGTGIQLDRPLERAHANLAYVEGQRAGTDNQDTQSSNLANHYIQKDGAQTAEPYQYWGWRYLQINAPGAGEPLTRSDLVAVEQFVDDREDRVATFDSDNETLDAVFELMRRSGRDSVQDTYLDTPTREKAGFLGDAVDISWANMLAIGERNATVRGIRDAIHSQTHVWTSPSNGYCTALEVPCSYPSLGTPGRMNSVYPNGDNMRDIPDYTEMFPDWVWRYYLMTGDRATLEAAYPAMQEVSAYIQRSVPADGAGAGLVWDLFGGTSSYRNGIIDWPAPMRYGYTFDDNAARTVHNASGVGAIRATQQAAEELGRPAEAAAYGQQADALTAAINGKLVRPDGLYTDGLARSTGAQIENAAQHAQTYPIYYGVAPEESYARLADEIERKGMNQGPMTLHILLGALARAGRDDAIVRLLTDRAGDGPARTLAEGGTFMWEQWSPGCTTSRCPEPNYRSSDSHSHGWGSWGIVDMLETLLGVQVTSPGAATVAIEPPALNGDALNRARGSVWTQRGTVSVAWERGERGIALDVRVPHNQRAEVRIPGVSDAAAYEATGSGAPRFERIEDGAAVWSVGAGDARFAPAPRRGGPTPPEPPRGGEQPRQPTPPVPPVPPVRRGQRRDRVRPRVTAVRVAGRPRVRGALVLRLRLSEPATVRVALQRRVRSRWRAAGVVSKRVAAGSRTLKIRLGRRPAGAYRAVVTARDRAGNRSAKTTLRFEVVARRAVARR